MKLSLTDPDVIYLQPECMAGNEGRTWCTDAQGECDCGEGHTDTKYVRAALAQQAQAECDCGVSVGSDDPHTIDCNSRAPQQAQPLTDFDFDEWWSVADVPEHLRTYNVKEIARRAFFARDRMVQQAQPGEPPCKCWRNEICPVHSTQQAQPLPGRLFEEWMDANMERPADPRATFYSEDDVRSVWNAVHRMAQQAQPCTTLAPNGFDAERIEEILGRADVPENYDGDEAESWIIMERILPDLKYLADAYRAQQAQPLTDARAAYDSTVGMKHWYSAEDVRALLNAHAEERKSADALIADLREVKRLRVALAWVCSFPETTACIKSYHPPADVLATIEESEKYG